MCQLQRTDGAATGSSVRQESTPLATEVKTQESGRAAKSSGFKFPSARVLKQDAAPITSLSHSKTASSSGASSSRLGSAADADADSELMRPVATTRMEAVTVNAAGDKATAETGSANGEVQPTYEIVYRGHMDLAQAWEGPGVEVASAKMPKVIPLSSRCSGVNCLMDRVYT